MLEFAVSTGTDISGTYRLLCRIYKEPLTAMAMESATTLAKNTKFIYNILSVNTSTAIIGNVTDRFFIK